MNWEDIVKTPDMAGTVGAVLGFLSAPGGTRRMQAFNLFAGIGGALFLAPYVAEQAGLSSQAARMAFAFLVGLVSMNILPKLTAAAQQVDWLSRFLPTKKGGES